MSLRKELADQKTEVARSRAEIQRLRKETDDKSRTLPENPRCTRQVIKDIVKEVMLEILSDLIENLKSPVPKTSY